MFSPLIMASNSSFRRMPQNHYEIKRKSSVPRSADKRKDHLFEGSQATQAGISDNNSIKVKVSVEH